MSLGISASPVFHPPAVQLTALCRDLALEEDATPFRRFWKLESGPLLGAVWCGVQRTEGETGLRVYDVLGTLKLPAGQDAIKVNLLDHSPTGPQISKLGENSEAGSMRVWCLHPCVLGRGPLCSYHRGQGRPSHWETKLRGRSELVQDTQRVVQVDSCRPISSDSPASSPDHTF